MKTILNTIKTIILTGAFAILVSIPVMADTQPTNGQDKQIIDHYTTINNEVVTVFKDGSKYINFNTVITGLNNIDNTITIEKNNNSYNFYVDDIDNYYLNEQVNITMDQNNSIIDCIVDNEPQVYNTQISQIQGNEAFLIAGDNKYSFENVEGSDGWKIGDKCKVVIQDSKLLEVRPIPLAER